MAEDSAIILDECGCCCEGVELYASGQSEIILTDSCGCDDNVGLHANKQPDVLLFNEFDASYENEVVFTRKLVEEVKETVEGTRNIVGGINAKTNLIPAIHNEICGDEENAPIRDFIKEELGKIDILINQEEASEKEVYQMFDGVVTDEGIMELPSIEVEENGYAALSIEVDDNGNAKFVIN